MEDDELTRLIAAEQWACKRCEIHRQCREDLQAAALAIWTEAKEILGRHRAEHADSA